MPAFLKQKSAVIGLGVVVIATIALGVFFLFKKDKSSTLPRNGTTSTSSSVPTQTTASEITWQWSGESWSATGKTPACPEPLLSQLPVDLSKVTTILYPGQTRGGNYKAHGGFRFGTDNNITVTAPLEANLIEGSHYIEGGEVQYMFTFINPCGIAYRFDHLHTLSEKFQTLANQLPEAKVDDSRTTPFNQAGEVKKGEIVATKVGFVNTQNVSVDFGVYDLRSTNQASKNPIFATTHGNFKQYIFYGVCWLEEFPSEVSQKLKSLPGGDSINGKTSDYCK